MPSAVHHVNLSVPVDGVPAMTSWLVDVLGYRPVPAGPEISALVASMGRELYWFEADDGHQVHLSPSAEHAVVANAHTAIRCDDALDAVLALLADRGLEPRITAFDGERHAFVADPAGNLWELVGP